MPSPFATNCKSDLRPNCRKRFRTAISFAVLVAAVLFPSVDAAAKRPNVVLIVIDTLRADAMSCYGYERNTTPNMDAFAERNIRFRNVIAPAGVTPPSMAAMMTGRLPFYTVGTFWTSLTGFGLGRFSQSKDDIGIPRSLDTLAEILQRNGYATAAFVTNPYVSELFQFDQGFDTMEDMRFVGGELPHQRAEDVVRKAIEWMQSASGDQPLFLYVHVMDVHYPYLPPESYRNAFSFERVPGRTDREIGDAWERQEDLASVALSGMREHVRGLYDSALFYVDEQIGALLDAIPDRNTIIAITSDHGEEFLDHGGTSHKGKLYDEHLRVPLLMRVPEGGAGVIDTPVQNFDMMPTILSYAGIDYRDFDTDAVNLGPIIEGKRKSRGLPVFSNLPTMRQTDLPFFRSVRTEDYKLLYSPNEPERSELYDLVKDPGEQENVFDLASPAVKTLLVDVNGVVAKLEAESRNYRMSIASHFIGNERDGFAGVAAVGTATFTSLANDAAVGEYTAHDESSALELPLLEFDSSSLLIVRASFYSPADTVFELRYDDRLPEAGLAVQRIRRTVHLGENTIYLPFRPFALKGSLQIRPGLANGTYRIHSLEVVEVDQLEHSALIQDPETVAAEFGAQVNKALEAGTLSQEEWDAKVQAALNRMTPEERAKAMEKQRALKNKDDKLIDDETRKRLEALGYIE